MPKLLTPEEFDGLLLLASDFTLRLRDAEKRWRPPADLEQAALTLHNLALAVADLQLKLLSTVANQAYARQIERQIREER